MFTVSNKDTKTTSLTSLILNIVSIDILNIEQLSHLILFLKLFHISLKLISTFLQDCVKGLLALNKPNNGLLCVITSFELLINKEYYNKYVYCFIVLLQSSVIVLMFSLMLVTTKGKDPYCLTEYPGGYIISDMLEQGHNQGGQGMGNFN